MNTDRYRTRFPEGAQNPTAAPQQVESLREFLAF